MGNLLPECGCCEYCPARAFWKTNYRNTYDAVERWTGCGNDETLEQEARGELADRTDKNSIPDLGRVKEWSIRGYAMWFWQDIA